jgi:hypothetical protein
MILLSTLVFSVMSGLGLFLSVLALLIATVVWAGLLPLGFVPRFLVRHAWRTE